MGGFTMHPQGELYSITRDHSRKEAIKQTQKFSLVLFQNVVDSIVSVFKII